jgi:ribosome-associated translation inhibitor RaiA
MLTPLEISFHGLERSDAVEARVREKFKRIESHFDRITHARVVIEAPKRRVSRAKIFSVRIEVGIPGGNPIVASYEPNDENGHTDVMLAIRDAFAAATRQVNERADQMDHPAKRERVRRRPRPEVTEES